MAEKLRDSLLMSEDAFVVDTLPKISTRDASSSDFNNFSRVADQFPESKRLLTWLKGDNSSDCFQLLARLIVQWTDIAVAEFPKTAAGLSGAEVEFVKKRSICKKEFVKNLGLHSTAGFDNHGMSKERFGHFGVFLFNILCFNWSYSAAGGKRSHHSPT